MNKNIYSYLRKSLLLKSVIVALISCFLYMAWLSQIKLVKIANLKIFDNLLLLKNSISPVDKHIADVVLISIDDESMRNLDVNWPWPRGMIATIIKKLSAHEPALINIDLVFIGKDADRDQDLLLANAIKAAGNILVAAYFGKDGRYVMPQHLIAQHVRGFGFVNKPPDADTAVRRMRPFILSESGSIIDYSLAVKSAAEYLNKSPEEITSKMPILKNSTAYISFFGTEDQFTKIPVWKVLKDEADLTSLKGKIVFVGTTSEIFHDTYQTPIGVISGVLINLNEFLTYSTQKFFKYPGPGVNFAILFFFVFIAVVGGFRFSAIYGIFTGLIEIVIFIGFSFLLLLNNIIIDYIGVLFLIFISSLFLYGIRFVRLIYENMLLKKEAITDGLTQLYHYRYFDLKLSMELRKVRQENRTLALALYDIDHFKSINDTYGHEFGNKVLKDIAQVLKENSRRCDTVARYGGEEFGILMPDISRKDAIKQSERTREKIKQLAFRVNGSKHIQVTISAGIATTEDCITENHKDFIRAADAALYRSKNSGRDRISVFDRNTDSLPK
ncbi:MAG: diguanylate cyclase [Candidatus Omnitrophica bacterium]|nr:diguanylate cyclase [Candidatus Omnitrophota bacterium]